MSAPVLAEGVATFEDREGGAYVVVTFDNGAAFIISRGHLFAASRDMLKHAVAQFEQQQAEIVPFCKGRAA